MRTSGTRSTDSFYAYWTIEKDGSLSGNDLPNRQLSVVLAYYIDILINRFWLRTSDGKTNNQMYMTWGEGQLAPRSVTAGSYNAPVETSVVLSVIKVEDEWQPWCCD